MKPERFSRKTFPIFQKGSHAFTLIELMLVMAIMAIAITLSYPAISSMIHRDQMTQAIRDVMEGCRKARADAILEDAPTELRIFSDGRMDVVKAPADIDPNADSTGTTSATPSQPILETQDDSAKKPADGFSAHLGDMVGVQMIDVNFIDYKDADMAVVKFFPNGTCDEFTLVLLCAGQQRKITLEVVTGLAQVDAL
jgi:prepilin-type N-terminal cleavage/methylation domain-containing protein